MFSCKRNNDKIMDVEFAVHHTTIKDLIKFISTAKNWLLMASGKDVEIVCDKKEDENVDESSDGYRQPFSLISKTKNHAYDCDVHFSNMRVTETSVQYDTYLGNKSSPDVTFSVFWSFKMAHEHHIFSKNNHPSDTVIIHRVVNKFKHQDRMHMPYHGLVLVSLKNENSMIKETFSSSQRHKDDEVSVRNWDIDADENKNKNSNMESKQKTAKVTPVSLTSNNVEGNQDLLTIDEIKNDKSGLTEDRSCFHKKHCTFRRLLFLGFLIVFYGVYLAICLVTPDKDEKDIKFESFGGKVWRTVYGRGEGQAFLLSLNANVNNQYQEVAVEVGPLRYILLGDRHAGAIFCWILSLFFDIFVVLMHLYYPAHPKFSLTRHNRISINLHVMSGAAECIVGGFIILSEGRERVRLVYYMAMFSLVHVVTAIYQTPIVFGTRRLMIPAYVSCVFLKLYCWFQLIHALWTDHDPLLLPIFKDPNGTKCYVPEILEVPHAKQEVLMISWFLALVLMHHVYVWCRVFVGIFRATGIFRKEQYTVAIILAGTICIPTALGFFGVFFTWFVILCSQPLLKSNIKYKHYDDKLRLSQELPQNPIFSDVYGEQAISIFAKCDIRTVATLKEKSEKTLIHLIYRIIDLSNCGMMHLEELRILVINWGVSPDDAKIFFHQYLLEKDTHGVNIHEFTEKLETIWRYGISSIYEAVEKIEKFDTEWCKLNPKRTERNELKPLSIHHLYGMPFNEDYAEDHKLHHQQRF